MITYSAKKIAALVVLGLAVFAIGSLSFIGTASAAAPSVQTLAADEIFDESATLNGYLYTGGEDTTYWFEYGTSRSNLSQDTSDRNVGDRDGRVTVSNTIRNGLIPGRTYYFRLIAENQDGIDQGEIRSFIADESGSDNDDDDEEPIMRTLSAQPSGDSAVLNGSVESEANYVQVWFRYGQSPSSLNSNTQMLTILGRADKSFSRTVRNLAPGATYYFQAVGENGNGRTYGQTLSFVAGNGGNGNQGNSRAPLVLTDSPIVNGRNSATLRAQVNPNGTLSSVWFEYGRSTSLGAATTRDPAGSGTASSQYSVNLTGLSAGTTYYYRAVAQNTSGTSRGQVLSFRTTGAPSVPANPGNDGDDDDEPTPPISVVTSTPIGAPDCFTVSPALNSAQLKAGDEFTYSVTYRNSCGHSLSNGSLQITLPVAAEFAGTNLPFLSRDGNVITYNLGGIAPNFQSAVTVNGKVRSQVATGDSLIFQANITFTDPNGVLQNASGFLTATIIEGGADASGSSTLGASAADALGGLFHSGWFWLVLFLILVALFVFWLATRRRDGEDEEDDDTAEVQTAH